MLACGKLPHEAVKKHLPRVKNSTRKNALLQNRTNIVVTGTSTLVTDAKIGCKIEEDFCLP